MSGAWGRARLGGQHEGGVRGATREEGEDAGREHPIMGGGCSGQWFTRKDDRKRGLRRNEMTHGTFTLGMTEVLLLKSNIYITSAVCQVLF